MTKHEIVIIFFRLLNFSISIGILVYFFKTYMLPLLKKKGELRNKVVDDLKNKNIQSQDQLAYLEEQITHQEKLIQVLQVKLHIWNQHFTQVIAERKLQRSHIVDYLQKKVNQQKEYIELHYVQKKVGKNVLFNARLDLEKFYKSEVENRNYISTIINRLQKSIV